MPTPPAEPSGLIERLVRGERRVIADLLTRLERQSADTPQLIGLLRPHLGKAFVAGVTGPPGAGKSTLVNALIAEARADGHRVAVLAVDPSSPVTGGAILGDRVRMTASHDDDGVMIRSLGSRGTVGGLSPAAVRMIDALDAAGFGLILLETVGTGQSEVDVAQIADVVVVISAPGLGDGIQAMKAGLLEIADILVVNKADRDGADRTAEELAAALTLRANAETVPVMKTAAIERKGIRELWRSIADKGAARKSAGLEARRRSRARYLIARAAEDVIADRMRQGDAATDVLADAILAGEIVPLEAAIRLLSENTGR